MNISKSIKDITGKTFGYLKVLKYSHSYNLRSHWQCECNCGNIIIKNSKYLLNGTVKSCGCFSKINSSKNMNTFLNKIRLEGNPSKNNDIYKDGKRHPLYNVWKTMRQRCVNPKNNTYKWYGGRGITICNEWGDPVVFIKWCEQNGYKPGLQLDRIDNNGSYYPENCRFITREENISRSHIGNPRNNIFYKIDNEILNKKQIYEKYRITRSRLKKLHDTLGEEETINFLSKMSESKINNINQKGNNEKA